MSDQLSKVVAEMRTTPNAFGWSNRTVLQWADRIESAAAPVEVELPEPVDTLALEDGFNVIGEQAVFTADQMREYARAYAATLARQLAEANSELSGLRASRIAYASEFPLNADGEPDTGSIHANIRAMKSQLAAATRRLGEVEGLVGKWREESPNTQSAYDIHNRYGDALENCADELEAALTKEPTK